jgi:hypothetical protein
MNCREDQGDGEKGSEFFHGLKIGRIAGILEGEFHGLGIFAQLYPSECQVERLRVSVVLNIKN